MLFNAMLAPLRARAPRRAVAGAFAAIVVIVLAALALPVDMGAGAKLPQRNPLASPPPALAPAEDLSAFMESRRWGVSLAAAEAARRAAAEAEAEAASAAAPPPSALDRIGFVGLTGVAAGAGGWAERAVLLALPSGRIGRFRAGDALPDGRLLAAVEDNSLTLAVDGETEVIALFPNPNAGAAPAEPSPRGG